VGRSGNSGRGHGGGTPGGVRVTRRGSVGAEWSSCRRWKAVGGVPER